ncbi:hypothetical protein UFOVP820_47 [uncultured Caudovirales phage]|uniref:DUF6950 domain-containing protein n=1 Tax=uncultured Caudovirales phage TaxID=2100421 RepID=A0A6J5P275_9CAUD|nr:hypothetical protein UFOVP820_47 [uncultured Caudovirales phage]
MKRKPNWQELLQDEFFLARNREFSWGKNDCAIFCAQCVERMTGYHVTADMKKKFSWKNKKEGIKLLASRAFMDMTSDVLGIPSAVNECTEGDVILVQNEGHLLLGMHEGHFVISVSESGIAKVPLENAVCGWRIP